MITSDFRRLLRPNAFSKLDLGEPRISFSPGPLTCYYEGVHVTARTVSKEGYEIVGLDRPVSVKSALLEQSLSLFGDDAPLELEFSKRNSLVLKGQGRRLSLQAAESTPCPDIETGESAVIVDAEVTTKALRFLTKTTGRRAAQPAFSGIDFRTQNGALNLRATDGVRLGATSVQTIKSRGEIKSLIPAVDVEMALSLCSGQAIIKQAKNTVIVLDGSLAVRIGLLAYEFPNVNLASESTFELTVGSELFRSVAKASSILDSARVVKLNAEGGRAYFLVHSLGSAGDEEIGRFLLGVGRTDSNFSLAFEAEYIELAGDMDGQVKVKVADARKPVLFESGGLKYWVCPLITQ